MKSQAHRSGTRQPRGEGFATALLGAAALVAWFLILFVCLPLL